jgi:RNA polymerase sigma-70 factor (ECF subfamily)
VDDQTRASEQHKYSQDNYVSWSLALYAHAIRLPTMTDGMAPKPDALTFDEVYREHRGRVLGAVRSVLGPDGEMEDVLQLAFIEIHRALPSFRGQSKLSTWIYRISVNVALQHIRKKQRHRWLTFGLAEERAAVLRPSYDSEDRLQSRQALERVYQLVNKLNEKKRTAWVLYEIEGMTPAEISEVLDLPLNTVRSRILSARKEILSALRAGEGSP